MLDHFFKSSGLENQDNLQYKIHAMGHCHIDTGKLFFPSLILFLVIEFKELPLLY